MKIDLKNKKIMFFDIETSYNTVAAFQVGYNLNLSTAQILRERAVITIAYMMEGDKKPKVLTWDRKQNDKKMLEKFSKILRKVDVVVAQNGDRFDIPFLKTRILHHRLPPINNLITIDTLKLNRRNFMFNSNKLDYVAKFLGFEGKMHTDMSLWIDIVEHRSKKALKHMVEYNKKDVTELRSIFWTILPYVDRLPVSLGKLVHGNIKPSCPTCASDLLHSHGTVRLTTGGLYHRYDCTNCGHRFRDTKRIKE